LFHGKLSSITQKELFSIEIVSLNEKVQKREFFRKTGKFLGFFCSLYYTHTNEVRKQLFSIPYLPEVTNNER